MRTRCKSFEKHGDDEGVGLGVFGLVVAVVMLAATMQGCAPTQRFCLLVGVDVSDSMTLTEREKCVGVLCAAVDLALPNGGRVCVWLFDDIARKIYDGFPRDSAEIVERLVALIRRGAGGAPPVTRPETVLEELVRTALLAQQRDEQVGILLLYDGENCLSTRCTEMIEKLAKMGNVSAVWVAGVPNEDRLTLRSDVERAFAPFGARVVVSGPLDAEHGLEQFRVLIQTGAKEESEKC